MILQLAETTKDMLTLEHAVLMSVCMVNVMVVYLGARSVDVCLHGECNGRFNVQQPQVVQVRMHSENP